MPHLSPLSWILAPMILLFIFLTYMSLLWWNNNPLFPSSNSSFRSNASKWHW